MSCNSCLGEFEFSAEEIDEVAKTGRLLSLEIEMSLHCNFRCKYCYVADNYDFENELNYEEICDTIVQARDLGARKIILLGGEPMIYPKVRDLIVYINELGLISEVFTNGTGMTLDTAQFLAKHRVRVVLKMNSFDEEVQNELAGAKNAYSIIQKAFANLKEAGYPTEEHFFAVSTVICQQNFDELIKLWCWLRDQKIDPYFEMITPQGFATENDHLHVDSRKVFGLYKELQQIDHEEYGIDWEPQPPLMGKRCLRHQYSCLVNASGDVMPCVGVTIAVGNVRNRSLKDIIADSEVMRDLRNHRETVRGPCGTCDKSEHCYGCRGAAYQLTGDYMASDPLCWLNLDRRDEIECLPLDVADYIPQAHPLRVVDQLVTMQERNGSTVYTVPETGPFIDKQGALDEVLFFEMMAQAAAAYEGFHKNRKGENRVEGFLLGAKKMKIHGCAHIGDQLVVKARKTTELGEFTLIQGTVSCEGKILAEGEIKLYQRKTEGAVS